MRNISSHDAWFVTLLGTLLLVGCSESLLEPNTMLDERDIVEMRQQILGDPLFSSDAGMLDDGDATVSSSMLGKTTAPIIPKSWGRRVLKANVDTKFERLTDSTALATVTTTIEGEVIILVKTQPRDTVKKVVKPFTDVTVRKVKFIRQAHTSDTSRGWKPVEVSAMKAGTVDSEVTMKQVHVTIGANSYTITDPTDFFLKLNNAGSKSGGRPDLPHIGANEEVKVRVTIISASSDTDWVSLHRPIAVMSHDRGHGFGRVKAAHTRMKLVAQTSVGSAYERVFEESWKGQVGGRHTLMVEALTKGSIYDDTARFSSQLWGVPYVVQ